MIMPKKNKTDGKKNPAMEEKKSAQYSDQTVATGTAGEVHQTAGGDVPLLTTQQGVPVSDDQNSLKIGARDRRRSRIFILGKSYFTLISSAFPNEWFTHAASARTAISRITNRWPT